MFQQARSNSDFWLHCPWKKVYMNINLKSSIPNWVTYFWIILNHHFDWSIPILSDLSPRFLSPQFSWSNPHFDIMQGAMSSLPSPPRNSANRLLGGVSTKCCCAMCCSGTVARASTSAPLMSAWEATALWGSWESEKFVPMKWGMGQNTWNGLVNPKSSKDSIIV